MSDQETSSSAGDEQRAQSSRQSEQRGGRNRSRHRFQNQPRHQQNAAPSPESALPMDELRDLVQLIAEHGFTDFELEREGFRVRLRRDLAPQAPVSVPDATIATQAPTPTSQISAASSASAATPSTQTPTASAPLQDTQSETSAIEDEQLHIITSPIVGTLYRAASPTSEPYVRIGSHVDADAVVCIIEAMKLMNEIQAEVSGEVAKIYVENGQPVEYGQPLFGIRK